MVTLQVAAERPQSVWVPRNDRRRGAGKTERVGSIRRAIEGENMKGPWNA
jgi:hypothetical protein